MQWLNSLNDKLLGLALAGFGILLVMWRDISLLKQNFGNHRESYRDETDRIKRTQDRQDSAILTLETRMAAQDVILARIDENIKTILASIHPAA